MRLLNTMPGDQVIIYNLQVMLIGPASKSHELQKKESVTISIVGR